MQFNLATEAVVTVISLQILEMNNTYFAQVAKCFKKGKYYVYSGLKERHRAWACYQIHFGLLGY